MDDFVKCREVLVRYGRSRKTKRKLSNSEDVAKLLRRIVTDNSVEHMVVLFLDAKNSLVGWRIVAQGSPTNCPVSPQSVFQSALLIGANAIIVAHNHPSGEVEPSKEDRECMSRLAAISAICCMRFLDALVWSDDKYYSFQDTRTMPLVKKELLWIDQP